MYIPYESLSKKNDTSTYIPQELSEAQSIGKKSLPLKLISNFDSFVAEKIQFDSVDNLWNFFSSEQIDSIGLSIYNFENNKNFIIGDETGIGKGRILSGICRWAFNQNKKVLFFTEREHLFGDFYRDLNDTNTLPLLSNPIIFHSDSKVFFNDEIVLKGTKKIVSSIEENGFSEDTNLVLSNYSQISLKQHKKNKKNVLLDYCKNCVIILDECHNATGDSATKKFLLSLLEVCDNIVFSSATFLKDETQLELYEKFIDFDQDVLALLKKLLSSDKDLILRKVFTYELTKKLQFWRREHQPLDIGWNTIICDNEQEQLSYVNKYSEIINSIFELSNAISKEPALLHLELNSSWFLLGSTINRLSRNLLLLLKIDTLVKSVKLSLEQNRKAVIVIDSTFSSIINKVIDNQSKTDNDENIEISTPIVNIELNFKQILLYIIEEVIGKYIKEFKNSISSGLIDDYDNLCISTSFFENLEISPIDMITSKLEEIGVECNEISGRTFKIHNNSIIKINKKPKSKLVSEFNNGEKNVIIITRAGASGLSLHASAVFKDQRVRELFELEITNRPTYRLQFIGRVHRKNQVVQPLFSTVVTKLPFEQRILNVEQNKMKKLQSHISGDDDKLNQENIYNFYTDYCNNAIFELLKNNPKIAYQMGIKIKDFNDESFYYVDSILKRCIVLNVEQQNFLYDYLIYCVYCDIKLKINLFTPEKIISGKILPFWHELDKSQQELFVQKFGKIPNSSINQFQFPWVGLMEINSHYFTKSIYSKNLELEFINNLKNEKIISTYISHLINHLITSKNFNFNFISDFIETKLKKIKLGASVAIKTLNGNIFGYIHNIEFPSIAKSFQYSNLGLIHIKTINPHLNDSINYSPEDYYISFKDLLDINDIKIYNTPIKWNQYDRQEKEFIRKSYCLIGHPIYMAFLKQAYNLGELKYYNLGGYKNMCVLLPNSLDATHLMSLKKPIYKTKKIMEQLIVKKVKFLSTTWNNNTKPTLKLEHTTGSYLLSIAHEVSKDINFIDFPLRKKLNIYRRGNNKEYDLFSIPYKDLFGILIMFENRNVIWFI